MTPSRRYTALLRPYHWPLAAGSVLLLLDSVLVLLSPWFAGQATSIIVTPDGQAANWPLSTLLIAWLIVLALQALVQLAHRQLLGETTTRLIMDLRQGLIDKIQHVPLLDFQALQRGTLLSAITRDTAIIGSVVTETLVPLLPQLLILVGAIALMLGTDPLLGIAIVGMIGTAAVTAKLFGRRLRASAGTLADGYARQHETLSRNLSMAPAIRAFNRQATEVALTQRQNAALFEQERRYLMRENAAAAATQLLAVLFLIAVLWMGLSAIDDGRLRTDQFVSALFYGFLIVRPVMALGSAWGKLQQAKGAARLIDDVFRSPSEFDDPETPDLPPLAGAITFHSVSFAYPGREPVLRNVTATICKGSKVAIMGANGSGKSTLLHLLARLMEPSTGHISFDDHDVQRYSRHSLRAQIGLVDQTILLAHGTVAENIAYGQPDASRESIERAATAAQAWPVIQDLPEGLETEIGRQGVKLSGGQRQRIALARALLAQPPILILDEATAMVDGDAEQALAAYIRDHLQDVTVIMVSHGPFASSVADRVFQLVNGELLERTPQGLGTTGQARREHP